jgi:hypothetical protein
VDPIDPVTPEEWQEAVNAAEFALLVDSARQYGLITGGPTFDVARCEDLLARGEAQGIVPDRGLFEPRAPQPGRAR